MIVSRLSGWQSCKCLDTLLFKQAQHLQGTGQLAKQPCPSCFRAQEAQKSSRKGIIYQSCSFCQGDAEEPPLMNCGPERGNPGPCFLHTRFVGFLECQKEGQCRVHPLFSMGLWANLQSLCHGHEALQNAVCTPCTGNKDPPFKEPSWVSLAYPVNPNPQPLMPLPRGPCMADEALSGLYMIFVESAILDVCLFASSVACKRGVFERASHLKRPQCVSGRSILTNGCFLHLSPAAILAQAICEWLHP